MSREEQREAIRAAIAQDRERHAPTTDADTWQRLDKMGRWPSDIIGAELNADPRSRFAAFAAIFADLRAHGHCRTEAALMASRAAARGES